MSRRQPHWFSSGDQLSAMNFNRTTENDRAQQDDIDFFHSRLPEIVTSPLPLPVRLLGPADGTDHNFAAAVRGSAGTGWDTHPVGPNTTLTNKQVRLSDDEGVVFAMPIQDVGGTLRWVRLPTVRTLRITENPQDGSNKRWLYKGRLMAKTAAGYGGWADDTEDTFEYAMFNHNEDQNGADGLYGNGVDQDNIDAVNDISGTGTMEMQPIPVGTRIEARPVVAGGAIEYWFDLTNHVDGECESPS